MPDENGLEKQDLLRSLQIAAPCNVSWESMEGNDRVRHCSQCSKNVYNLSSMSGDEANKFLQATAQQACVQFYRRVDGTILLDNCPVGLRRLRAQYRKIAATVTAILSFAQGFFLTVFAGEAADTTASKSDCQKARNIDYDSHWFVARERPITNRSDSIVSIKSYRNQIKPIISATMPKNADLGNAAIYLFVNIDGSIKKSEIYNPSPSKATDATILKAVKSLKLPPLPKGIYNPPLCIYYECHTGAIGASDEKELRSIE